MTGRVCWLAPRVVVGLCVLLVLGTAVLQTAGLSAEAAGADSGYTGWGDWVFRLAFLAYVVVGRLVVSRAHGNSIGPLFLATGFLGLVGDFSYRYADVSLSAPDGPLLGGAAAAVVQNVAGPPTIGALGLALLLFPDGRLPSRGVRWAAAVPALGVASVMLGYAVVPGPI